MPSTQSPTPRPPAPGTASTVHLLIAAGRMPVVSADRGLVVDQPVTYLRLQVGDTRAPAPATPSTSPSAAHPPLWPPCPPTPTMPPARPGSSVALEDQGWRVEPTNGGHWRCYAPDGEHIVHLAGTPSDRRSLDNALAKLGQDGFKWPPRK